eukprot:6061479-Amphidinium_carterae.1
MITICQNKLVFRNHSKFKSGPLPHTHTGWHLTGIVQQSMSVMAFQPQANLSALMLVMKPA